MPTAAAAEAHGGGPARRDEPAPGGQFVALRHAVLVPAHVGDQHRVGRQGVPQVGQDPLRPEREGVAAALLPGRREGAARAVRIVSRRFPRDTGAERAWLTALATAATASAVSATAPISTG